MCRLFIRLTTFFPCWLSLISFFFFQWKTTLRPKEGKECPLRRKWHAHGGKGGADLKQRRQSGFQAAFPAFSRTQTQAMLTLLSSTLHTLKTYILSFYFPEVGWEGEAGYYSQPHWNCICGLKMDFFFKAGCWIDGKAAAPQRTKAKINKRP